MKLFQNLLKPKWQNSDPEVRKKALLELNKESNQSIFVQIAKSDEVAELRQLAVKRIEQFDVLQELARSSTDTAVKELANKMLGQMLTGESSGSLSEEEQIKRIDNLDDVRLIEYVVRHGKTATARKHALAKVTREALLGDIVVDDPDDEIKTLAAYRLTQKSTLERVFKAIKTRNKVISKIVKDKLDQLIAEEERPARLLEEQKRICLSVESLGSKGLWERDKLQLDGLEQQWQTLKNEGQLTLQNRFDAAKNNFEKGYAAYLQRHEERLKEEAAFKPLKEQKQQIINDMHALLDKISALNPDNENEINALKQTADTHEDAWKSFKQLPEDIEKELVAQFNDALGAAKSAIKTRIHNQELLKNLSSVKNELTRKLESPYNITRNFIERIEKKANISASNVNEEVAQLKQEVNQLLRNATQLLDNQQATIDKLFDSVKNNLGEIEKSLADGVLRDAVNLRKQVQTSISELEKYGVKNLNKLKNRLSSASAKINELASWRSWANTPQKEILIKKVESLIGSEDDPKEIAFLISQAKKEWKSLGPSEQASSQELWERFQSACDKAYEPCKAYFEEQNRQFERNFRKRQRFIEDLETFINSADWNNIDWKKVEHLYQHVRNDWQNLGKTDPDQRKELNKRFYAAFEVLKENVSKEWDRNLSAKQQLVEKIEALVDEEDLNAAIESAKKLQASWKNAGRIQPGKERTLWRKFRTANDKIFSRREDVKQARDTEIQAMADRKAEICRQIEAICNRPVSEIAGTKGEIETLRKEFSEIGETRKDLDKQLQSQLNHSLHIYERKLESLETLYVVEDLTNIKHLAALCDEIEGSLVKNASLEPTALERLNQAKTSNNESWNSKIQNRVNNIKRFAENNLSLDEFKQTLTQNLETKHFAVIQLEIIGNVDTPEQDANERLKLQTQRLSEKLKNRAEETLWDSFLSAEITWLTHGIPADKLAQLSERHANALLAIKSEFSDILNSY